MFELRRSPTSPATLGIPVSSDRASSYLGEPFATYGRIAVQVSSHSPTCGS